MPRQSRRLECSFSVDEKLWRLHQCSRLVGWWFTSRWKASLFDDYLVKYQLHMITYSSCTFFLCLSFSTMRVQLRHRVSPLWAWVNVSKLGSHWSDVFRFLHPSTNVPNLLPGTLEPQLFTLGVSRPKVSSMSKPIDRSVNELFGKENWSEKKKLLKWVPVERRLCPLLCGEGALKDLLACLCPCSLRLRWLC